MRAKRFKISGRRLSWREPCYRPRGLGDQPSCGLWNRGMPDVARLAIVEIPPMPVQRYVESQRGHCENDHNGKHAGAEASRHV